MTRQPVGRRTVWLLPVLAAFACLASAGDNYTLSVKPVWNGHVKPGVPSELGVRLLGPQGGHASLTVRGSHAVVRSDVRVEAGIPLETHLPLAHDSAAPVAVELEIDGDIVDQESLQLHMLPTSTTVVAIVSADAPWDWPTTLMPSMDTTVLYPDPRELPHTGQAYQLVSALFIVEAALHAMSSAQQQALAEYAASCGLLYLSGVATAEARALRAVAGCGGRFLVVPSPGHSGVALHDSVSRLPSAATLGPLVPQGQDTVLRSIVVFLVGYILVLLLGARSAKTAYALLALPPAATALAVLAWSLASPRIQLATVAEMDSGDTMARFAGLLQVTGTAPAEIVIGLPAQLGLPSASDPAQTTQLTVDPTAQTYGLHLQTQLMSRHAFRVEGIARGAPLTLESTANGVRVTNLGDSSSASAILAWRGQRYSVPGLAAGQRWSQPDEPQSWGHTAAEQLLRLRATDGGSWLLLPYDIPHLGSLSGDSDSGSWLLVRGAVDA